MIGIITLAAVCGFMAGFTISKKEQAKQEQQHKKELTNKVKAAVDEAFMLGGVAARLKAKRNKEWMPYYSEEKTDGQQTDLQP